MLLKKYGKYRANQQDHNSIDWQRQAMPFLALKEHLTQLNVTQRQYMLRCSYYYAVIVC